MVSIREEKAEKLLKDFYSNKHGLSQEVLTSLIEFDKENQNRTDISPVTRSNYLYFGHKFFKAVNKNPKDITREDINEFLLSIKEKKGLEENSRTFISLYFRFLYKDDNPLILKGLKKKRKTEKSKKLAKEIIKIEEYNQLLSGCESQRDRAVLSVLYHSGCRIGELLNIKIKDIEFFDGYYKLKLEGKTGQRQLVITNGMIELQLWLRQHPQKDNKECSLFLTRFDVRNPKLRNKSLGLIVINQMLNKVSERTIKRKIYPHLLRHSFATRKSLEGYNEQQLKVLMGWSKNSNMAGRYNQMKDIDVQNIVLQKEGFETEESKNVIFSFGEQICERCSTKNSFDASVCLKCFLPFSEKGIIEQQKSEDTLKTLLTKLMTQIPEEKIKQIFKEVSA